MTDDNDVPSQGPALRGEAGRLRMFHRVLDCDLMTVRDALIAMRDRFDGHVAEDALAQVELVLAEVLNNIVHHGTGTGKEGGTAARRVTIHLTVTRHDAGLACAVSDDGAPLPLDCLITPDRLPAPEAAAMRGGGFGWYIIRDLTQSLFYLREGERNVLCFNVPRQGPDRSACRDVA